jgi:hypothetical protein
MGQQGSAILIVRMILIETRYFEEFRYLKSAFSR